MWFCMRLGVNNNKFKRNDRYFNEQTQMWIGSQFNGSLHSDVGIVKDINYIDLCTSLPVDY